MNFEISTLFLAKTELNYDINICKMSKCDRNIYNQDFSSLYTKTELTKFN